MAEQKELVTGTCKCGKVEVNVDTSVKTNVVHCLCKGCRDWTGTPVWTVAIYKGPAAKAVSITKGDDVLKRYRHPGLSYDRCFCSECGTSILNMMEKGGVKLFAGVSTCIF
eukprot:CAMPEP_0205819402 /NCGR_PEP_ID=MMETSP0206-20130828/1767_1 /ASSEMBLY_ACC=CAM_ASM_000279 /TAXON_ID=36767 /ORGANISM="Euplotes focardii, Strain TN1" /LENGTH=110 /DNA_ID=CAMNT_0053112965 /DNA_START=27 /DNA_END=356 /DNA_ORIENTATION=-